MSLMNSNTPLPFKPTKPNHIHLLVFKDNFASRTFQIPISWISCLGLVLGIMILSTGISAGLAWKYYRQAGLNELPNAPSTIPSDLEDSPPSNSLPLVHSSSSGSGISSSSEVSSSAPLSSLPIDSLKEIENTTPLNIDAEKVYWKSKSLNIYFVLTTRKNADSPPLANPIEGKIFILV
jgi:hypothetical protein